MAAVVGLMAGIAALEGKEQLLIPLLAFQLGEGGQDDGEGGKVNVGVLLLGLTARKK